MSEKSFKAPIVGDVVNYAAHNWKSIIPAKVTAVPEKNGGRLVTIEIPDSKKNADGDVVATVKQIPATFRPLEDRIGNTWHHVALMAFLALLLTLGHAVRAGIPTYHTYSANGNAANPSTVIFPADPNLQTRLVNVFYIADTNNAAMQVSSGTTPYTIEWTNLSTTTVTNIIEATNGLAAGGILVLQHAGLCYTNDVVSVGNSGTNTMLANGVAVTNLATTFGASGTGPIGMAATNVSWVVLQSGGWGVLPSINDELYLMGPISTYPCTGTTNIVNTFTGEDIFSANFGRPLLVMLIPALKTNQIIAASAHYDSASQP